MAKKSDVGIVYIAKNEESFKDGGWVKIGVTLNIQNRLKGLSETSVPFPFVCVHACQVNNYKEVERAIHDNFSHLHIAKEFYKVDPKKVIKLLEHMAGYKVVTADASSQLELALESQDKPRVKKVTSKDGIPDGYCTYEELKKFLSVKPGFRVGYFVIRVGATHKMRGIPMYLFDGKKYLSKDVFLGQAKVEGVLKG
jgi:hypothetical protein